MIKNKKILPYFLTLFMVFIMIGSSLLLDNPEIIFPEIIALTIGAWLAPNQIWKTSPIKLVSLIMIYSTLGVILVKYIDVPLYLKIVSAFFMCSVGLLMSHTTFAPLICACILPILLETDTWIYPLSATLMAFIIVIVQRFLQVHHYQNYQAYYPVTFNEKQDILLFIKRMIVIMIISGIAVYFKMNLLIAPPLLVTFIEMSGPHPHLRQKAPIIFLMIIIMSFISAYSRYFFVMKYHISLLYVVPIVTIILLVMIYCTQIFFPPLGSLTILPFIIDQEVLLLYPLYIAIGFVILTFFAFLISIKRKKSSS